jgi:starch synthase
MGNRTGGLADTIVDGETGFLFDRASAQGFLGGLCRPFSTFGMKDRLRSHAACSHGSGL